MTYPYGNTFAKVYNLMWGDFSKNIAPGLIKFYKNNCKSNSNMVLDLCCGTGHLAKILLENDFEVIGIDISDDMLQYARENTKDYIDMGKAVFKKADASKFSLNKKVSFAVSTYDSLNHLDNMKILKSCFESVYDVLIPDCYFIFDLNTEKGLKSNWNSVNFMDEEEVTLLIRGMYDDKEKRGCNEITGFVLNENGMYEKFDELIYNTAFKLEDVKNSLESVGFKKVYFSQSDNLEIPIENPEKYYRVFVVARK